VDLPGWALVVLVLVAVWALVVAILVLAGRAFLAREFASLLPNLIGLFAGLLRDRRVPFRAKVVLALAGLWLASPIDLIPDFIPVAGSFDDAIVAALALRFVLGRTDRAVLLEHWRGDPRTLERIVRLVSLGSGGAPHAGL